MYFVLVPFEIQLANKNVYLFLNDKFNHKQYRQSYKMAKKGGFRMSVKSNRRCLEKLSAKTEFSYDRILTKDMLRTRICVKKRITYSQINKIISKIMESCSFFSQFVCKRVKLYGSQLSYLKIVIYIKNPIVPEEVSNVLNKMHRRVRCNIDIIQYLQSLIILYVNDTSQNFKTQLKQFKAKFENALQLHNYL